MYGLTVVTPPSEEPITVQQAKDHLRVTSTTEDGYILELIKSARIDIEQIENRAFVTRTLKLTLAGFPGCSYIDLPRAPLQSVTSVKYYDTADTETTLSASDYRVDTTREPGRIVLKDGATWPTTRLRTVDGVVIEYVAGYGDRLQVPEDQRHLLKFLVAHWYQHREPTFNGSVREIPHTLRALIMRNRVFA